MERSESCRIPEVDSCGSGDQDWRVFLEANDQELVILFRFRSPPLLGIGEHGPIVVCEDLGKKL